MRTENSLIHFGDLKVSWVKAYQISCLFIFTSIYPPTTGTLWNTIECCRGFEDMKDEISSSLNASDIFGLIFY